MTQLTTAFLGTAHIHTPRFIGKLNRCADEVCVKSVYDHSLGRGEQRAGELPGASFVADPRLAGGGALLDLGAHVLDQIIDIFPQNEGEITGVTASLDIRGGRYGVAGHSGRALRRRWTFEAGATAWRWTSTGRAC